MTPQQRAELDARVATILANTEAKNGAPLDPIEEDAIMMAVAQQMQAQWAAEEKAIPCETADFATNGLLNEDNDWVNHS